MAIFEIKTDNNLLAYHLSPIPPSNPVAVMRRYFMHNFTYELGYTWDHVPKLLARLRQARTFKIRRVK